MSTSRDRTSTVGRMWWLGDVTSSKEEGEAVQGGQGAPSTKKQEEGGGKAKDLYAYVANAMCLGHCRTLHSSIPHMSCSGYRPVFNNCFFSSILSTETSISSFRPVGMSNRESDWRLSQESESHSPRLAVFIKAHSKL